HGQGLRAGAQDRGHRAVAPQGRRARGDAEQVRPVGRSAVTAEPRRVLFVTGKLAEPALRRTLAGMDATFAWEVAVMKITVAALIDVGCTPGREFPELGDVVHELVAAGARVSVDSFDPAEIRTAVGAGAELVLSVNGSNLDVARELAGTKARVVVIPDFGQGIETLEPSVAALEQWGVSYLIDPVIEPIGFGFMRSLERYAETRRRYPG